MSSFSEYFEAIKGMATEGAQIVAKKTTQIASIAKANLAIRSEEEKIKKAQMELGKLYYKDYIVGEEPDPAEYNPWCEKISESKIAIEDLKIAIEDMRASGVKEENDEFVVEVVEVDENEPEENYGCDCDFTPCSCEDGCDCNCSSEESGPCDCGCDCSKEKVEE